MISCFSKDGQGKGNAFLPAHLVFGRGIVHRLRFPCHEYGQDIFQPGLAAAVIGDLDLAKEHLLAVAPLHSDLMKMSKWMQDCDSKRTTVEVIRAFTAFGLNSALLEKLKSNTATSEDMPAIANIRNALTTLESHGVACDLALKSMVSEEFAGTFLVWQASFSKLLLVFVEERAMALEGKFNKAIEAAKFDSFTGTSSAKEAEGLKKAEAALSSCVAEANQLIDQCGVSRDRLPQLEQSEKMQSQATGLTVAWGCRQLLNLKTLNDQKKGAKARTKLEAIYVAHMKDQDCTWWTTELLQEVAAVVDKSSVAVSPQGNNSASSSSQVEPAAPAKKAKGAADPPAKKARTE